jgi:hypothetical protein
VAQAAPWPPSLRAPREDRVRPEDIEHTPAAPRALDSSRAPRGHAVPPGTSEPPLRIPHAPVVPRVDIDQPDLLETLPLPRGAGEVALPPGAAPRTPLEARVRFTFDTRELARHYRRDEGLELRLEARVVGVLQRRLEQLSMERLRPPRKRPTSVRSPRQPHVAVAEPLGARPLLNAEEARLVDLHGAMLSELLARLRGAEWTDLTPVDRAEWTMGVPSRGGEARPVRPFGRVLEFLARGGEEDLVTLFRKLRDPA